MQPLVKAGLGFLATLTILLAASGCGSSSSGPSRCDGVTCSASDQCHLPGVCDPATGSCSNPAKASGVTCDDGNACTDGDACSAGTCIGGAARACPASDQCHLAGACNPATGTCSNPAKTDGAACDDGNGCTVADACLAGACAGGASRACPATDQCHDAGVCEAATGTCTNPPKANGAACDDHSLCTTGETCQSGACVGSVTVTCATPAACHAAGTCSPATGVCSDPVPLEGTACDLAGSFGTCHAGVCGPAAGIEGAYHMNGLSAGPWNGWDEGTVSFDAAGVVTTFRGDYSDATISTASPFPRIIADSAGRLTTHLDPGFWGTFSSGGAEALFSYLDSEGSATLGVLQRQGSSLGLADLTGTWALHALAVGIGEYQEAAWYRVMSTVGPDGATTRTVTDRTGATSAEAFTSSVAPDGAIGRIYPFLTAGRGGGALSTNGQFLAAVWTPIDGGFALEVGVRPAVAPRIADLTGDWSFHVLSASAPSIARTAAGHGAFSVDGAGALAVVHQRWTTSGLALPDGVLGLDGAGVLLHSELASFQGRLSADGALIIGTFTWGAGGDSLLLAQRLRVPLTRPVLQAGRRATGWVDEAGGRLEASAGDGTLYRLDVPAGAFPSGQGAELSMTPIASIPGLPVTGPLLGAVQLEPNGLALQKPALLTIGLPGGASPVSALGFSYPGMAADWVSFLPASLSSSPPGSVALAVSHFSGAGTVSSSPAQQADGDQAFTDLLGAVVQSAEQLGLDPFTDPDVRQALDAILGQWCGAIVEAATNSASTLDELAQGPYASVLRWEAAVQLLDLGTGVCDYAPGCAASLRAQFQAKIPAFIDALNRACKDRATTCEKVSDLKKLLAWFAIEQLAPEDCLGIHVEGRSLCGLCLGDADKIPSKPMITCGQTNGLGNPIPCTGLAVPLHGSRSLSPSFRNVCGAEVDAVPDWSSIWPRIASVDSYGGVTGNDLGTTFALLRPKDMPCVAPAHAPIRVYTTPTSPTGQEIRYLVTVTSMAIMSDHIDCGVVKDPPAPYLVTLQLDGAGVFKLTSFTALVDEETRGTTGGMMGGVVTFRTAAYNFYMPLDGRSSNWLIERNWRLQGGAKGFSGYYDWGWVGNFYAGHFTGCQGRNQVTVVPWPPPGGGAAAPTAGLAPAGGPTPATCH